MDFDGLVTPANLSLMVPIIVVIGWILTRAMKHRERMAMIEKGMNPDEIREPGSDLDRR